MITHIQLKEDPVSISTMENNKNTIFYDSHLKKKKNYQVDMICVSVMLGKGKCLK